MLRRYARYIKRNLFPHPEGQRGLAARGHRQMVGGKEQKWDAVGRLQFELLVDQGLRPEHVLLDVACGSFRGGRLFIPYLNEGNYLGIEKQEVLVREGRKHEIPAETWDAKRPQIVISDRFDFSAFDRQPDFALAQSLFTHLNRRSIRLCMRNLHAFAKPGTQFFATFAQTNAPIWQFLPSHSSRMFQYSRADMIAFGERNGWDAEYIGDWNHPARQVLVRYVRR